MNEIKEFYYSKIKTKELPEFEDLTIDEKDTLTHLYLMKPIEL